MTVKVELGPVGAGVVRMMMGADVRGGCKVGFDGV